MASVNNPVASGFVASLAKPGGNITGITTQSEVVLGKLIAILHEIAPRVRRIAFLLNESNPNEPVFWAAAQSACATLDLTALRIVANAKPEFGAAVGEIIRQDARCRRSRGPALSQRARQPSNDDARHPASRGVCVA
jgi:putative ABC transport system substrate-binding protein